MGQHKRKSRAEGNNTGRVEGSGGEWTAVGGDGTGLKGVEAG